MLSFYNLAALLLGSLTFGAAMWVLLSRSLPQAALALGATLLGVSTMLSLLGAESLSALQLVLVGGVSLTLIGSLSVGVRLESNLPFPGNARTLFVVILLGTGAMMAGGASFSPRKGSSPSVRAKDARQDPHRVSILVAKKILPGRRQEPRLSLYEVLAKQALVPFLLLGVVLFLGILAANLWLGEKSSSNEREA